MRYLVVLIVLAWIPSTLLGQDEHDSLTQITSEWGWIQKVELSPYAQHIAMITINSQGDTAIEVVNLASKGDLMRVIPDLTLFNDFTWSPNGQFLATRGLRGNGSGTEFAVIIYDIFDPIVGDSEKYFIPPTRWIFKEFVYSDDQLYLDYQPIWGADSRILAINRTNGIYFYDILDCPEHKCNLLYVLEIGYVEWFDWRDNTLITIDDNVVKFWDVSDIFD